MTFPTDPPPGSGADGPDALPLPDHEETTLAPAPSEIEQVQPVANDRDAELDVERPPAETAENGGEEPFTVGEKIASLLDVLLKLKGQAGDPRVDGALVAFEWLRKLGFMKRLTAVFPPLEDEEAWHQWLGLAVGICLALPSDGYELDIELCRQHGRDVLGAILAE